LCIVLVSDLFIDVRHHLTWPIVLLLGSLQIWVRNYQIVEQQPSNALEAHQTKRQGKSTSAQSASTTSLVEIGPRFVLNPIRIFRGSFGGQTLFQNPNFVSPNEVRAMELKRQGHVYEERKKSQEMRKERQEQIVLPEDPLDSVFR
jgi:ribosome biogenesis protein BRX1